MCERFYGSQKFLVCGPKYLVCVPNISPKTDTSNKQFCQTIIFKIARNENPEFEILGKSGFGFSPEIIQARFSDQYFPFKTLIALEPLFRFHVPNGCSVR